MIKKIWNTVYDFVWKNSKWMLPVLLIAVVAIVVAVALGAKDAKQQDAMQKEAENSAQIPEATPEAQPTEVLVPLVENSNAELHTLLCTYYNAYAEGDVETIRSISSHLEDTEAIKIPETSVYVESYPELIIYTKEGPSENSYLAYVYFKMKVTGFEETVSGMETYYVCTKEDGTLYINNGGASQEEMDYIQKVSLQEDVVELYNRVTVECSDTFANNLDLYYYVKEVVNVVNKNTGEQLAQIIAGKEESGDAGTEQNPDNNSEVTTQDPVQAGTDEPVYAKTTTTVNVRSSDSEQADKVDKVSGGTKVEVIEQRLNGWTKVKVNGAEGFIKSEFLSLIEVVNAADAIGRVTAKENVNVRMAPSTDADRLGTLSGGTTVDLLEQLDGWCKINYNGQVGYVNADYVQ